jgi:hypothetical protein
MAAEQVTGKVIGAAAAVLVLVPLLKETKKAFWQWWDSYSDEDMKDMRSLQAHYRRYCPNDLQFEAFSIDAEDCDLLPMEKSSGVLLPVYLRVDAKKRLPALYRDDEHCFVPCVRIPAIVNTYSCPS